jgi:branched-chain amino acid transport system substrate-binding protein
MPNGSRPRTSVFLDARAAAFRRENGQDNKGEMDMLSLRGVRLVMVVVITVAVSTLGLTAATATRASQTVPGVTDDSVKVGGIATVTSPFGFGQPNVEAGFKARIERANREGGIFKRKIDFIGMKDDKISAATSAQLARELVQQDQVFVLAPVVSPVFGAGDFLEQQKVPYLGWGVTDAFCGNQYAYGFDGCLFPSSGKQSTLQGGLAVDYLKKQGKNPKGMTVATQAEDLPAGQIGAKVASRAFQSAGFDVVYKESNVPIVPGFDWTPYVKAIMTSNNGQPPDIVNAGMTVPNAVGLMNALNNAGYKGMIMSPVTYDSSVISDATANRAAQNSFIYTNYTPVEEKTAATQQLKKDVKKIGAKVDLDYQVLVGYWIGDVLVDMLKKAGPKLTRESFQKAASTITAQLKGGYGPTKYPLGHDTGGTCGALLQLQGKKFVPQLPFKCYPTTATG